MNEIDDRHSTGIRNITTSAEATIEPLNPTRHHQQRDWLSDHVITMTSYHSSNSLHVRDEWTADLNSRHCGSSDTEVL